MRKLVKTVLLFLLTALLLLGAAAAAWVWTPHGGAPHMTLVEIKPGYGLRTIANALERATGMSASGFEWLAKLTGNTQKMRAGVYEVQAQDSPWEILNKIVRGAGRLEALTIVEGWTFAQMRTAIEKHPAIRTELRGLAPRAHWQALNLPGAHPEGLFFPDTYLFAPGTTDKEIYRLAFTAMQRELNQAWQERAPNIPLQTPYEALILASIVEKETGIEADRGKIAGVFVNRLKLGMRLQTDPTVIYGLGERFDGNLRRRDLETDTTYNTYTRAGLPPTPIALPGRAALRATLQPTATRALYFVARGDGSSQFSDNLDDHNRAVARYQLGR